MAFTPSKRCPQCGCDLNLRVDTKIEVTDVQITKKRKYSNYEWQVLVVIFVVSGQALKRDIDSKRVRMSSGPALDGRSGGGGAPAPPRTNSDLGTPIESQNPAHP